MASKVEIYNQALQNIGGEYITSENEDTQNAIECNLRADSARKALLEMHQWNFATKRAKLNKEVATPEFGYAYQYTLPSDFLYMVMTQVEEQSTNTTTYGFSDITHVSNYPFNASADDYVIEDGKLLSNSSEVNIIYIADVTNTGSFSATFTQLFARYLGALIAFKVVGSKSERDTQMAIFEKELAEYQSIDSQQGRFKAIRVSEYLSMVN
jgi:hypothetical protein